MGAILTLVRTLGPVAALLIGLAGGGTLIGGLGALWNVAIDNPQVAREAAARAEDACTIRTMDAANRAREAEQGRQQSVVADALAAYRAALSAREAQASQIQDQMEASIADYEARLSAEGRSCPLDDADLDWLRGKPGAH